jgi:hypothetical protein
MNKKIPVLFIGGIIFGFGLAYGQMAKPEIVLDFLTLHDLGLLILMAGGAVTTAITINVVAKALGEPLLGGEFKPRERNFSKNTLIGAAIFGVGWGLSGQCPGSVLSSLGIGNYPVLIGVIGMFLGAYIYGKYFA